MQVAELADAAHGFVPADLGALCNEAALAALRRLQHCSHKGGGLLEGASELCVTMADFTAAEIRVRPSAMREVAVEVPKVSRHEAIMPKNCGVEGNCFFPIQAHAWAVEGTWVKDTRLQWMVVQPHPYTLQGVATVIEP
jgi:hypothetical protein